VTPAERPDLSIVIVHYETPDLLERCLAALAASDNAPRSELFVVDNASRAFVSSIVTRHAPQATVIVNSSNRGFAVATNQGLRRATGRHLLLLNPDTVVAPDTLAMMVGFMDGRPEVGAATPRVVLDDGRLDPACRRLFPTPLRALYRMSLLSRIFPRSRRFGQYNLTYLDQFQEAEIDSPSGAFMIVRSEVGRQVGLLDERYFMYGEDLDWAFRIKQAGWRIVYTPRTTVRHTKRASSRQVRRRTIRHFHDAMRTFYRLHYQARYPRLVSWLVYRAIDAREQVELAGQRLLPARTARHSGS
jgi:N-acetylglucosaminyl-diphospho-decaprenol L-rhamnosyltransferase